MLQRQQQLERRMVQLEAQAGDADTLRTQLASVQGDLRQLKVRFLEQGEVPRTHDWQLVKCTQQHRKNKQKLHKGIGTSVLCLQVCSC